MSCLVRLLGATEILSRSLLGALRVLPHPFLHPAEDVEHQRGEGGADTKDGDQFGRHACVPSSMNRVSE